MEPITILAWISVVGVPILVLALAVLIIWRMWKKFRPKKSESPPEALQELNVKSEPEFPKHLWIDPSEWENSSEPETKLAPVGFRIWRVYRSLDRTNWVELDPATTERAACNYAQYIKANNTAEYVRVNDPDGMIVFYE